MSIVGLLGILVAFAACVVSLLCLGIAHVQHLRIGKASAGSAEAARARSASDTLAFGGRLAAIVAACALTLCCAVLVWCFFSGDVTLDYVVRNRSDATGELAWLFKLAGLWAGRAGSLLFWAWLISVFGVILVFATRKNIRPLDNGALAIAQLVLVAFVGVLLFSPDNMPFALLDPAYFDENGQLKAQASVLGMNTLLEHWAMAIHPPTLFIGYAGLTIPFAYAISALIVNDDSDAWVCASTPYLMFSWLLLGAGIGLGAVWAYVVLGWGGYWGWDPVENASLLPWLVGVALIHSFTVYRQRGAFKRWSVMCACITFSFVVLGTFITRSGIVQSVHAFEGDSVSLVLFAVLIVASLAAGAVGLIVRHKSFGVSTTNKSDTLKAASVSAPIKEEKEDDIESLVSRDAAYYVNNLVMVAFAVLLAYMTVSSALPAFLPFGGQSLSAGTYNAIARPLGVLYCALIAVCPLLGWRRTQGKAFFKNALIPGVCALVVFAVLMAYFCTYLLPSYEAILAGGGSAAEGLLEQGAPAYYNAIAVVGFLVASLLFFNSVFMLVKALRKGSALRPRLSRIGGAIAHAAMGIILVGLIGSSMYVTETNQYLQYDADTKSAETLKIQDFELVYTGEDVFESDNGDDVDYVVHFDVYRGGQYVGSVSPAVQMVKSTQQQKLEASVIGFPLEDLFVVYRGMSADGEYAMDVRVNPLISFVWVGFGLLMLGSLLALFARRTRRAEVDTAHA
ncbi:heme lyase CcmF/NrfE family subunit [Adlercreutzia sp. ZJ154]|uniref:heme lyase CcmF/NrfE family subunit n=1 Tax=Adlercreutzia sp. ZJ154 TaxID=2709790 RepID=UPI0013EDAFFB|nr:cytochrome c biogenesis protein CcsA [Adlercreutzia sp. ZJ154]